jgi:hypothetical protein
MYSAIFPEEDDINPVLRNMEKTAVSRLAELTKFPISRARKIFRDKVNLDNGSTVAFMHYYNEVMISDYPERICRIFDCKTNYYSSNDNHKLTSITPQITIPMIVDETKAS